MNQLVVLLLLGIAISIVGLIALRRSPPALAENDEFARGLNELITLRGLSFKNFPRLFADSDYRMLLADPRAAGLAEELRRDRRRIALQWLMALQKDVFCLWHLSRLLTKYGASRGVAEEFVTLVQAWAIVVSISLLRLLIFLFGPFGFSRGVSRLRHNAHAFSRSCGVALRRLPEGRWMEFLREWRVTHPARG